MSRSESPSIMSFEVSSEWVVSCRRCTDLPEAEFASEVNIRNCPDDETLEYKQREVNH